MASSGILPRLLRWKGTYPYRWPTLNLRKQWTTPSSLSKSVASWKTLIRSGRAATTPARRHWPFPTRAGTRTSQKGTLSRRPRGRTATNRSTCSDRRPLLETMLMFRKNNVYTVYLVILYCSTAANTYKFERQHILYSYKGWKKIFLELT